MNAQRTLSDWSPSRAREALRAELSHVVQAKGESSEEVAFLRSAVDNDGERASWIFETAEDYAMTCLDRLGHVPGWSR